MSGVVKKQDTKTSLTFFLFLCWQGRSRGPVRWRLLARGGEGGEGGGGAPFGERGAQHLAPVCFSARPAFSFGDDARGRKWEGATLLHPPDAAKSHEDFLTRLRLGEGLQAHVETRLVSWSHVSDSSVATLLRDYPLASRPAAADDVPARAPSALLLLDILAAAPGRMVGRAILSLSAPRLAVPLHEARRP